MRIGMVGLGKMGANMTLRLLRGGHEVVAFDLDPDAVAAAATQGATGVDSLAGLVAELAEPRAVWLMVPAGDITGQTIAELEPLLSAGDVVVDGGNSRYTDTQARSVQLAAKEIALVDAGTSGGIWGLDEGFCLMVGGSEAAIKLLQPAFDTLAPEGGFAHVGTSGAGHYTKMVHNGIEYAMMQAYGEGFELLRASDFNIDPAQVSEVWRHGSVVRSWLLDLAATALSDDPELAALDDFIEDSGEGRWTVQEAIDRGVPTPAIAAALFARLKSQQETSYSGKLISALRREFGGHAVHAASERKDGD